MAATVREACDGTIEGWTTLARQPALVEHRSHDDGKAAAVHSVLVVGYGLAGAWFHDPLVTAVPRLQVSGVVTGRSEAAELARSRHPDVRVHADVAAALGDDAVHPDLVVVATPNDSHGPITRQALEAGCAVVVDKPLAPTMAEARDMVDTARRLDLPLSVFHNRRWDGDFLTVQQLIADGALGEVHRLESRFDRWRPAEDGSWRMDVPGQQGGGLLLDLAWHLIDQALLLFGPVATVYAELGRRRGYAADDDVFLALEHRDGQTSHLHASALAGAPTPRFRVSGDGGAYLKYGLDVQEDVLQTGEVPVPGESGREPEGSWGRLHRGGDGSPVPTLVGDWTAFYRGLRDHLEGSGPNPVPAEEGLAVMRVIEAARSSAAASSVIALG